MKRPPFLMLASRRAVLRCDGRFVLSGRASFVWETFLLRRASGIPGRYEIRLGQNRPWHRIDWSIMEAEDALVGFSRIVGAGERKLRQCRTRREARIRRNLPVA